MYIKKQDFLNALKEQKANSIGGGEALKLMIQALETCDEIIDP